MPDNNVLQVFLDGALAGFVEKTSQGRTSFTYDGSYQSNPKSAPLSFSMPLAVQEHSSKKIKAFLAGLVPESDQAKERVKTKFNLRSVEPFALLGAIGRDAAGAVQILPADEKSSDAAASRGDVRRLSKDEFSELIRDLVDNPLERDPSKYLGRWSLAGAQSKVALFKFDDGGWGVPQDSTPTTHILKPAIPGFAHHDVNEFMSLHAAEILGLDIAQTEVIESPGAPSVLVSTRYDRVNEGGNWSRLHQEDMCQALSILPEHKYQVDGGPGVAQIAEVIAQLDHKKDRDDSAARFFGALLFNVMAGCTDAHAKNYSLLLRADSQVLTPLYDVATHSPYSSESPLASAMKIGDEYRIAAIGKSHFLKAAKKIGVSADVASEQIDFVQQNMAEAYAEAAALLESHTELHGAAVGISNSITEMTKHRGWTSPPRVTSATVRNVAFQLGVGKGLSVGGEYTTPNRPETRVRLGTTGEIEQVPDK